MGAACSSGSAGSGSRPSASRGKKQPKSSEPCELEESTEREERKLSGDDPSKSSSEVADCQEKQLALQETPRREGKCQLGATCEGKTVTQPNNKIPASEAPMSAKTEMKRQSLGSW